MEFKVLKKSAAFIIWITATLTKTSNTEQNLMAVHSSPLNPTPENVSIPAPTQNLTPIWPSNENDETKCEPMMPSYMVRDLPHILTPEIFSQDDPVRYLFDKMMNLSGLYIATVQFEANIFLKEKQSSECYIPYAMALSSLLSCWDELDNAKQFILGIRRLRSPDRTALSLSLSRISPSSKLHEIFSSDIFSDPEAPWLVFCKLLNLPDYAIQNLRTQLQSFLKESIKSQTLPFSRWYTWYAKAIYGIIKNKYVFDELKRNLAEIQHDIDA